MNKFSLKIRHRHKGFSLIEILISLLVLSGAITTMFSGFDRSSQLDYYSAFESEAAFLAEREIELLKADLLDGKIKPGPAAANSRLPHKKGWKITTVWTDLDQNRALRIVCSVNQSDKTFKLESFLYIPPREQN